MSRVAIWRCERCGRRSFPRRELCPFCAGRVFAPEHVDRGSVTEVTRHHGVAVASVRVDDDVSLLARADGGVAAGAEVALHLDGGAPVATPA